MLFLTFFLGGVVDANAVSAGDAEADDVGTFFFFDALLVFLTGWAESVVALYAALGELFFGDKPDD